jgi:hypothetical protein
MILRHVVGEQPAGEQCPRGAQPLRASDRWPRGYGAAVPDE